MARRRRAVERATFRRTVTDRVVVLVLVVVTASGLMSVLPGSSQRLVSRTACRAVSLGLGACGAAGLDLEDTALAIETLAGEVPGENPVHVSVHPNLHA